MPPELLADRADPITAPLAALTEALPGGGLVRKSLPLTKAALADDGPGAFSGYASTFGNVDSVGDEIAPSAFAAGLADFLADGFIAADHDWTVPIATVRAAREDTHGLWIEADFHSDPASQLHRIRMRERLDRGKSVKLSIGFEILDYEIRTVDTPIRGPYGLLTDQVRVLTRIKLYEVSVVAVPANDLAAVTGAKSGRPYADEADAALAAVAALTARTRSLAELRAKSGRVLSEANRQRLSAVLEVLSGLDAVRADLGDWLESTAPASTADTSEPTEARADAPLAAPAPPADPPTATETDASEPDAKAAGLRAYLDFQSVLARLNGAGASEPHASGVAA